MIHPILFAASDFREVQPWTVRWDSAQPASLPVHWARSGKFRGKDVIAVANGVGAARAASAMNAVEGIAVVVSIGTCGALDPSLKIADIVVADSVTDGTQTWRAGNPAGRTARTGLIYSAAHIARTREEKGALRETGAIAVEMEAAALARAAERLGVPFYCVRAVSDLADESFACDFEEFLMPDGRFNVPRLILQAVTHPFTALPEMIRLGQRTNEASRRLAEFLAGCEF